MVVATAALLPCQDALCRCFNPWRVFLVVATLRWIPRAGRLREFQSLAGFLGRCDALTNCSATTALTSFNPWRVFLVVATEQLGHGPDSFMTFQSLAGFLGRCDGRPAYMNYLLQEVSIPGGFSWSLRLLDSSGSSPADAEVSIPGGFSWSLRQRGLKPHRAEYMLFQSLAGFLGRCDPLISINRYQRIVVSIPGGFSWSLRR